MKSLIHTNKNKAFAQPGVFSCHLSGKSHLACNLWCTPPHLYFFFKKRSSQTSTSPLRGALTTYAQELLPSGMLHLNKICLCVATVLACQEHTWQQHAEIQPLCVIVKEQKGSPSSTGVNSLPQTMLRWKFRPPAQRGFSGGFPGATRFSGKAATSSATLCSKMMTYFTYWVDKVLLLQNDFLLNRNNIVRLS